jgi:hypothetical protein
MFREPADVKDQEYKDFYKGVSKDDTAETLGWAHFKVSPLVTLKHGTKTKQVGRHWVRCLIPCYHVHSRPTT